FFAHADVFDRDFELVGYADDHAALGGTVEFGKGECIDIGCLGELFALFDGVLAGGGIEHQQDFVGRTRHDLLHDLFDLGQLVHQRHLIMQPTGGVDDGHIVAVGHGRLDRIVRYRGGV